MSISVTVTPSSAGPLQFKTNTAGEIPSNFLKPTQKFSATVTGDPGNAGVAWSVDQGGGHVDEVGNFTPSDDHGHSTVKATSVTDKTKSATATVFYFCPNGCLL